MNATHTAVPVVRSTDQGERRAFLGGGIHVWKATESETAGAFLIFEMQVEQGKASPLHTHPDSDETMIVLSGEIHVHIAGELSSVGPGGIAIAPRGVPHAFQVTSAEGARVLCLHTPGSCEAFYRQASEPVTDDLPAVDMTRVMTSAAETGGMHVVGPPPFAPIA